MMQNSIISNNVQKYAKKGSRKGVNRKVLKCLQSPTADTQTTPAGQDVGLSSKINLSPRRIGWSALDKQYL